jgi:hypothetical protein
MTVTSSFSEPVHLGCDLPFGNKAASLYRTDDRHHFPRESVSAFSPSEIVRQLKRPLDVLVRDVSDRISEAVANFQGRGWEPAIRRPELVRDVGDDREVRESSQCDGAVHRSRVGYPTLR